jgi:hypothetical protein
MADAGDEDPSPPSALAPRMHSVVALLIFAQLPVDSRARCACVCRGWRAVLAERSLWTRLDVSRTSGVTAAVTNALLRGAAARAGGALQTLDVSGSRAVSLQALLAVVTANAATLHAVCVCHGVCDGVNLGAADLLTGEDAEALLRAAPVLRVLGADVRCDSVADARRLLRAEGLGLPAPLRVRGLRLDLTRAAEADALTLVADVAAHAWLQELCLVRALPTLAALDAFVDAALAWRLTALLFASCGLNPASAPALARLLGGDRLTELCVLGYGAALLDAPAATLLAGALRANSTLTKLQLLNVQLFDDAAAAGTLLGALTAHPSLRTLSLSGNTVQEADRAAAGTALGALLAANAPALTELNVSLCNLGDAGMAPLLQALPANTHLRTLNCSHSITEAFAAAALLPAVRANASLRALETGVRWAGAHEAERVVAARRGAAGER